MRIDGVLTFHEAAACDSLAETICGYYGVKKNDFMGGVRRKDFSEARHCFFWLARNVFELSYSKIGRLMNRDHTTIINGCNRAKGSVPQSLIGVATDIKPPPQEKTRPVSIVVCFNCDKVTPRTSSSQRYCPDCRTVVVRRKASAKSFWTDERVEMLKALNAKGFSRAKIAAQIGDGCTKGMVIGKIARIENAEADIAIKRIVYVPPKPVVRHVAQFPKSERTCVTSGCRGPKQPGRSRCAECRSDKLPGRSNGNTSEITATGGF